MTNEPRIWSVYISDDRTENRTWPDLKKGGNIYPMRESSVTAHVTIDENTTQALIWCSHSTYTQAPSTTCRYREYIIVDCTGMFSLLPLFCHTINPNINLRLYTHTVKQEIHVCILQVFMRIRA